MRESIPLKRDSTLVSSPLIRADKCVEQQTIADHSQYQRERGNAYRQVQLGVRHLRPG